MATAQPVGFFSFPNPVNDVATRVTAGCIAVIGLVAIVFQQPWLAAVLAYGFVARVAAGPRLSPLALLVTRVVVPRFHLPVRPTAGPPKRFAQAIGATVTLLATLCYFAFGWAAAAYALLAILVVFATLESTLGLCVGCKIFGVLMRAGVIPEDVCAECNDLSLRSAGRT